MYKKFTRIYRQLVQFGAKRRNTAQLAQTLTCAKNITVPDHLYVSTFAQIKKSAEKNTLPNRIYTIFGAKMRTKKKNSEI